MSRLVFKQIPKISRGHFLSIIQRGYRLQMAGIIPGGGLGKLQGIKEEEYFIRQDNKLVKNLREKSENPNCKSPRCMACENAPEEQHIFRQACSVNHKNILEEAYFLNDHCDSLQLLMKAQTKADNQDES